MIWTILATFLFTPPVLFGQTAEELSAKANAASQAEAWDEAAAALEQLVTLRPESGSDWYQLGVALHRSGDYAAAVTAYEKVLALPSASAFHPFARFRGAESLAAAGKTQEAMTWLQAAVDGGFAPASSIEGSDALEALRGESSYIAALDKARRNTTPCEFKEEHRQFDFWIGDWDVFTPTGQQAGTNNIEKIVNGCVIYENWTSATGGVGKSFNFYDASDDKWHQLWVDGQGNVLRMSGTYKDGVLDYTGETPTEDGAARSERLRFFDLEGGLVRQLWEQSSDGGKTWTTAFDGEYRPKK